MKKNASDQRKSNEMPRFERLYTLGPTGNQSPETPNSARLPPREIVYTIGQDEQTSEETARVQAYMDSVEAKRRLAEEQRLEDVQAGVRAYMGNAPNRAHPFRPGPPGTTEGIRLTWPDGHPYEGQSFALVNKARNIPLDYFNREGGKKRKYTNVMRKKYHQRRRRRNSTKKCKK